jgi:hypothetical protein
MMTAKQFIAHMDRKRELRAQGIETRSIVARCQVGNHPIFESEISSDDETHATLHGKPICFSHQQEQMADELEKFPILPPHVRRR